MTSNTCSNDDTGGAEKQAWKDNHGNASLLAYPVDEIEVHILEVGPQSLHIYQARDMSLVRKMWYWLKRYRINIAMLLIVGTSALAYFRDIVPWIPAHQSDSICLTPGCVLAASVLLQNLSPRYHEIDPCTNFDKYVCEGWDEKHDLRADQDSAFTGTAMEENSQLVLRHILESPYSDSHEPVDLSSSSGKQIFKKLKDAYDACMNEDTIKENGSGPLLEVLGQIEKRFPAARPEGTIENTFGLHRQHQRALVSSEEAFSKTVVYLETIGVTALVSFSIDADDKDPDSVILTVNAPRQPGLPSKEYYKDKQVVQNYSKTIGQVLEALLHEAKPPFSSFASLSSSMSEDLVRSIVNLETRLAQVTPDAEDAEDVTKYYNPHSLAQVNDLIPQLSIENIISSLGPQGYLPDKIIVESPTYLTSLSTLLQETSVETLLAYFVWKTVQAYANRIKDDALKPLWRFNNQLQGKEPDATEERWRTCVKSMDNDLGWILSRFFIEKAFSVDAKQFGDDVIYGIKEQFIQKLKRAEWMSKDVRKLGIEKVHNIVQKIGYPTKSPDLRNSSMLQEYYASVDISSTEYFHNAISVAQFDAHQEWSALGKPTDRNEWDMTAPTVNAYYNPAGNEIVFPAGIMQAPVFYDPSIPTYLSYGAFGSVSGHELSHAFDSTGRHYDQRGNYTEWWSNTTIEAFKTKAQCFIDQFHQYSIPGLDGKPLHINGRLTLGENIADSGGLSASFAAWKQLERSKPSQLLPGLQNFSKDQLFFLSYANWWCGKTRKESAIKRIYSDPHAPMWARILGTMANSREFKQSFQCATKEPTCELW